jgi:hypothetical protein
VILCPTCSCHVRSHTPCPTCGRTATPARGPSLVAVLLGLALAGCPKPSPDPAPQPEYGVAVPLEVPATEVPDLQL